MLEKCVNPFCNRPFSQLNEGKVFSVEFPPRLSEIRHCLEGHREQFWLCKDCAHSMSLAVRREFNSVAIKIINLPPREANQRYFSWLPQNPKPVSVIHNTRPLVDAESQASG